MGIVESLSAVTLHVADMDRSTAFYDALGLARVYSREEFTSYEVGDSYLNLQTRTEASGAGWGRAILYCDDVDAMYDVVVAAGGKPDATPSDAPWGERFFHVADPDGHELSFARPITRPVFRPAKSADRSQMLAMNQLEVPAVSSLDRPGLDALLDMAHDVTVAWRGGHLAGFVVLLREGSDYASPNYRWFAERVPQFLYVDRVVIAPDHRRRGVGRALYEQVLATAGGLPVLAEVNLIPPNTPSLAFHRTLGFEQMGQLAHTDGKTVAMLRRSAPQD